MLASQPGWGKTRIVQEFYGRLADMQVPRPGYWPPALADDRTWDALEAGTISSLSQARKAVYPRKVEVPGGAEMDWMWWGVLCHQRAHGQLAQAMFDDAIQLYAHARDPHAPAG